MIGFVLVSHSRKLAEGARELGLMMAPDVPVDGSVCYKMLIGSDTLELYYFKKHKITSKNGKGFLASDLKAIKSIRKR